MPEPVSEIPQKKVGRQILYRRTSRTKAENIVQAIQNKAQSRESVRPVAAPDSLVDHVTSPSYEATKNYVQDTQAQLSSQRATTADKDTEKSVADIIQENEDRKDEVQRQIAAMQQASSQRQESSSSQFADPLLDQELAEKTKSFVKAQTDIDTHLSKQSLLNKLVFRTPSGKNPLGHKIMRAWDYGVHYLREKLSPQRMGPPKAA